MTVVSAQLLVGNSRPMRELRVLVQKLSQSRLPVLIEGETGTGKELVALAVHSESRRRGPFVAFNVCAIPDTMFESTLFGHVRGAFTGAAHDTVGLLAEAHSGTAFFDEVTTLPPALQGKLLRVLETGAFRPVGARSDRQSDFRIVAASNESLMDRVDAGVFRADLAQRLAGGLVYVPPLRERPDDIADLATHFLRLGGGGSLRFGADALRALTAYSWPGNVRELRMLVDRLILLCDHPLISADDVKQHLLSRTAPSSETIADPETTQQRAALLQLLARVGGDTIAVARSLGLHRSTLYRRMTMLGITAAMRRQARWGEPSGAATQRIRSEE